jgi:hypothetical protein
MSLKISYKDNVWNSPNWMSLALNKWKRNSWTIYLFLIFHILLLVKKAINLFPTFFLQVQMYLWRYWELRLLGGLSLWGVAYNFSSNFLV